LSSKIFYADTRFFAGMLIQGLFVLFYNNCILDFWLECNLCNLYGYSISFFMVTLLFYGVVVVIALWQISTQNCLIKLRISVPIAWSDVDGPLSAAGFPLVVGPVLNLKGI
jgi:hypothetical protein